MASRFNSNIHERSARSALFSSYDSSRAASTSPRPSSSRPTSNPYGYTPRPSPEPASGPSFGAYPGSNLSANGSANQFRSATPNSRGQYSDAVLNELESQNDEQMEGMIGKVKMLKNVTISIGDEIRSSTALAEKMNDSFDSTRVRLRGTMNRMLRMAERSGVGWRVWLAFFAAVILLFWYVWLF